MSNPQLIRQIFTRIPVPVRQALRNGLLAGLAAAVFSLFIPNQYKSEVRILPADSRTSGGAAQMAVAAAAVGVSVPGQDSSDAAFMDIVNSRWMAKKLLMEEYQFNTRAWMFGDPIGHKSTLYAFLKARNLDHAIKKTKMILRVKRDFKSKLLTISVETPSPELSQQVVRKVVKILESFIQVKAQTRGGNKAAFTTERLKEAEAASGRAEQESQDFLNVHRNYATSNEPAVRLKGARLEAALKLRQQVVMTLTLNVEQALLEEKNDMPILNVLDEGDLPIEKNSPSRMMTVFMAIILCGGGTYLWVYMREQGWLDRTSG